MTDEELATRFTYHAPKDDQPAKYKIVRGTAYEYALTLKKLCPISRELSLAITKLEEAVYWANAAIARRE